MDHTSETQGDPQPLDHCFPIPSLGSTHRDRRHPRVGTSDRTHQHTINIQYRDGRSLGARTLLSLLGWHILHSKAPPTKTRTRSTSTTRPINPEPQYSHGNSHPSQSETSQQKAKTNPENANTNQKPQNERGTKQTRAERRRQSSKKQVKI